MVILIPEYRISILLAIAVHLFLEKILYPGTRIVEEVSAAF
jgi:hypothetical protein